MEISILKEQFSQLKTKLLYDLNEEIKKIGNERLYFSNLFFHVNPLNPDVIFSVYGMENGNLLVDSTYVGFDRINLSDLPIEGILHIKNEIDFHQKNKIISPDIFY